MMRLGRRLRIGSPAWAGIDPTQTQADEAAVGFPRVGGDRPYVRITSSVIAEVPPRGRG